MTELRLDPTIRNWVIIAPERSKRPDANPSSPEATAAALRDAIAAKESG